MVRWKLCDEEIDQTIDGGLIGNFETLIAMVTRTKTGRRQKSFDELYFPSDGNAMDSFSFSTQRFGRLNVLN